LVCPEAPMVTQVKIKDVVKVIEHGFFSEAELARRRNVHPRTLLRWSAKGSDPKPTLIHKKKFYEKRTVYAWEREQEKRAATEGARS
jgi:DNA invertase Pin-like site-specific DNA recombinase